MNGPDGKAIQVVEWQHYAGQWRLRAVYTTSSCYDFAYSEHDGNTYYRDVGGGVRDRYTVHPFADTSKVSGRIFSACELVDSSGNKLTAKTLRQLGYQRVKELPENPFENAVEGDVEWCEVCKTHVPTDDRCRHIQESFDGNGYVYGSGASDLDVADTKRSLIRLFEWMPETALQLMADIISDPNYSGLRHSDSLLGGDCSFEFRSDGKWLWLTLEPLAKDGDADDRYRAGIAWLYSLDNKTQLQNCLTAGWIWEYLNHRYVKSISVECKELNQDMLTCPIGEPIDKPVRITSRQLGKYREAREFKTNPTDFDQIMFYSNKSKKHLNRTFTIHSVYPVGKSAFEINLGVCVKRSSDGVQESLSEKRLIIRAMDVASERKAKRKVKL